MPSISSAWAPWTKRAYSHGHFFFLLPEFMARRNQSPPSPESPLQCRVKGYLKAIKERLEKDDPDRVPVFTVRCPARPAMAAFLSRVSSGRATHATPTMLTTRRIFLSSLSRCFHITAAVSVHLPPDRSFPDISLCPPADCEIGYQWPLIEFQPTTDAVRCRRCPPLAAVM